MVQLEDAPGGVVVRQRLEAHPSSVSRARRLVTAALDDLGRPELSEDAALVVSELVTNALVHAGTPMELVVAQRDYEVVVEVLDDNPRLPFRRNHAEFTGTGRGLHLVDQLATEWGSRSRPPGKTVWCRFAAPVGAAEPGDERPSEDEAVDVDLDALLAAFPDLDEPAVVPERREAAVPTEVVEVVLLQVPLLLHAAWQLQVESVLREYLLTRLDGDDDRVGVELEAHAAVHEALVLLQEQVPAPDLGEHPEELMAAAVEPLVSAERLQVTVPRRSLAQFDLLNATLDAAGELADAGGLLTPPTQPEVRAFRRWLCREVSEQGDGRPPRPWGRDLQVGMATASPQVAWDSASVSNATRGRIAAEDTNHIVAVSPAAARLLGYSSGEELVGRRLLDIIPPRYRQAHVAGLTLHLFSGRSPLLNNPVVVPALRADGSEVLVDLLVEEELLPGGRRVFVADLAEAKPAAQG